MKRNMKYIFGVLLVLLLALSFVLPPAAWAKHRKHRRVMYKYIYYPTSQVYYSPVRSRYYYQDSGAWTYAPTAPATINLGKGISINLGGRTPYVYHPTVIRQYPVYPVRPVVVVDDD